MGNAEWAERMKRLLTGQKQVKKVFVTPSVTSPRSKINLLFKNRVNPKPGEDESPIIFWMELDERQARKLINDLTLKLRYMHRLNIEKGEEI